MVMKKNAMRRNLRQSIVKSLGRYIAITAIITLGAGLFLGLVMTKADMVATGQEYMDNQNMFDLRMISNYAWPKDCIEDFEALPGVELAEGQIYMDLIAQVGEEKEAVYRFHSIQENVNKLSLRSGRMPEVDTECLADGYLYDDSIIGEQVVISRTNDEDSLDAVKHKKFTVVGLVSTPLYMDMNRGTTSVGSGVLQNYFFVPESTFDLDYYIEIDLTLEGNYAIYSDEYSDALEEAVDLLEPDAQLLARRRYDDLKGEIEEEYNEGYQEYQTNLEQYLDVKALLGDAFTDAEVEAELKDAELELSKARKEIDEMAEPELFIMDRERNIGYSNLNSSSDIVAGVSRVFPAFFLLIASLVCITTMTRMIDEERTQIGTLKALGYSSAEIISKYLIYSGSGAVIGCILGITLGCSIFPMIIWDAYKIMLYLQPDVVLTVNWVLAGTVSVAYLTVMLLVTWYCCYKTLQEEPAQLIRPKAPEAGKKILLEYLPVWQKLKFLNKVAIRNIFRYRQRLAMMMIGIGGCTALLIAGFGLRDSVVNVVDYQFRDVTHYDISVYFREELTDKQQKEFERTIKNQAEDFMYYHQSSVELDTGRSVKELYMIAGDSELKDFITLQSGESAISLPGRDEVVLSIGVAENMGIRVGDRITLRSADLEEMDLEVTGIYDNYIYNYCIVDPDTIETHWGEKPELQMAFVTVEEGGDVYAASADITDLETVLNVSVSDDLADMVSSMMEALDLVVLVAVISAALLAIIVLYNLTNININERIREIATIKVLGFNAMETAAYVFKENMVLTVAGAAFGLATGRLLLEFIMAQVKIDMVWFRAVLNPSSCVLAVVLTLLSAVAVEFIFYFKLEKINMAEALKSVE